MALSIALATGDPEPGGLPPVFTAICLVLTRTGYGTGFFVGERANVVTARHVVRKDKHNEPVHEDERAVLVCWVATGRGFLFHALAEVVREDERTDLALLRLKNPEQLPRPLSLDSLTSLSPVPAMPRDFVYFDAFRRPPVGGFECRRVQARVKQIEAFTSCGLEQRILTLDAKSWPGASGSPVFSKSGEVVGVLTNARPASGEAMIRDGRWLWELFGKVPPGSQRQAVVIPFSPPGSQRPAVVIPFSPRSFAPYMHAPWWSPLQRLGTRMYSYLGRPWIR